MDISPAQRLILMMLCDVHKHLKIKGEIDADFVAKALFFDSWALEWRYGSLSGNEDVGAEKPEVTETADVLQMYT